MRGALIAAPLTRGEASEVSGGFIKPTPHSPRLRGGHAPLVRGAAKTMDSQE